jgi:hypothetical protein
VVWGVFREYVSALNIKVLLVTQLSKYTAENEQKAASNAIQMRSKLY